jgi:heterodisulfide reductase subunit C2
LKLSREKLRGELIQKVEEISGENISTCYQCGKCSAGCPLEAEMGILPHQVIRLLQLGCEEEALNFEAIWLCAACHTCESRCPKGFDLSRVMEALRVIRLRSGYAPLRPEEVPAEVLTGAPQQAIVGCYRKYTG